MDHIVNVAGVRTDPEKVAALRDWPVPTTVKELCSFLGLCSYYRRFVKSFIATAASLGLLTKRGRRIGWTAEAQGSSEKLIEALFNSPVLTNPDPLKPFILESDASDEETGGVLCRRGASSDLLQHVHPSCEELLHDPEGTPSSS